MLQTGLTRGELLLTEAAVGLLHLDSDTTPELDVPVPLPGVHFVLLHTQLLLNQCLLFSFTDVEPLDFLFHLHMDVEPGSHQNVSDLRARRVLHSLRSHTHTQMRNTERPVKS